jgi:hypothetical protein
MCGIAKEGWFGLVILFKRYRFTGRAAAYAAVDGRFHKNNF